MDSIKGICKTCLGCNQLENKHFTGTHKCKDYKENKETIQERFKQIKLI